jgi:uncharacterized protein (TIRG00374 family)
MRMARYVLLALGTTLIVALFWRIGVGPLASAFGALSWRLPLLLCFPAGLMIVCDTLGWRFSFRRDRVPFGALLSARLAGEAFNITTPTGSVGGEPIKAWLVRPYASLAESLPSVVIAKTTITIGQMLFLLLGILVAWSILPAGSALLHAMRWLLVLECVGTAGFVAVQVLGTTGRLGRLLHRVGLVTERGHGSAFGTIDRAFVHFYRHEPRRLALSVGWHFAGWAVGVLETYLILHGLGFSVPLGMATVVDAFGAGVGFASFLIPARLGAQEAGDVAVFAALGFGAPAGLAFTLIRRLREALWAGVGLVALAVRHDAPPAVAALESEV